MAGDSKALVKKEGGNRRERRANEKSKVDNTHRRTWDKEDYEERAAAREKVAVRRMRVLLLQGDSSWVVTSSFFVAVSGPAGRGGKRNRCQAQEKAWCVDFGVSSSILCSPQTCRKVDVIPSTALHGHALFLVCCTRKKDTSAFISFPLPAERDPLHQGIIVERAQLKQRDFSLDLTSRLGKSQVITNTTPLNQQVGLNAVSPADIFGLIFSLVYLVIMLCSQGVHTRQAAAAL